MALFLSLLDEKAAGKAGKVSLTPETHVKTYRIWMAALLRDTLTPAEHAHTLVCDRCNQAFSAALGLPLPVEEQTRAPLMSAPLPAKSGDTTRAA